MPEITNENRCDLCKGRGIVEVPVHHGPRKGVDFIPCSGCKGLGTKE